MPESSPWSGFALVLRSEYRRKVLETLANKPLGPGAVARATGIRIVHVSRALSELEAEGLVECVNPEVRRRGRVYAITRGGEGVVKLLETKQGGPHKEGGPEGSVGHSRRIRGATLKRALDFIRLRLGNAAREEVLAEAGLREDQVVDDAWYPVDVYEAFLKGLDRRWPGKPGEGVVEAGKYTSQILGTIRQQVFRAATLEELAERAPIVWNKELNFGRVEVLVGDGWAVFSHYDWYPFPELCRIFEGSYSGILEMNGVKGRVEETKCMRLGHDRCEFQVRWEVPNGSLPGGHVAQDRQGRALRVKLEA